ncbi:MAG TPA: TonB-dependent receptor [Candidatus Aquilonibacter sp.]|nr:TonB-dependent receptor [Candidatus Aquilonibacter sp.]
MRSYLLSAMFFAVLVAPAAHAEGPCKGAPLAGIVVDPDGAIISGANISLDAATAITSGSDGRFRFPCVADGSHHLQISAESFGTQNLTVQVPLHRALNAVLHPETVETTVDVAGADAAQNNSATAAGPTETISGKQLQSLADDPDDLLQELQQLAAAAGGSPGNASVAVDGIENGEGTTHLPPKSSIAYIKVNPDLFSAEYREPPFEGGRIEVYTKPGQPTFHGALFTTNSSSWMNARDPFSTSSAPIGKQRYGFELSGPVRRKNSDFFTSLEHRQIDNVAVVNAVTVNAAGQETPVLQTVAAPQHLWVGNFKTDWQLGAKNTFIASFDNYNNDRRNMGVGGTTLAEAGYSRSDYDYNLHLTDVTTVSPKIMNEAHIAMEWDGADEAPNSTAPQVSVAGAFTGGGSSTGTYNEHELWASIIEDAIIQTKNHLIKIGIQPELDRLEENATFNYNGAYTFGGGVTASGQTLTGIQQYVNALNGAPNGSPTAFSNTAGNPRLLVDQFRNTLYYQDDWKVRPNLHFAYGVRYYVETPPRVVGAVQPRLGVSWSPDKKATWNLHAHAGMFAGRISAHNWLQIRQMDGVQRVTSTVYNPSCTGGFDPNACAPLSTGTAIHSIRTIAPHLPLLSFAIQNLGLAKTFPKGFTFTTDFYLAQIWHYQRSENINSPLSDSPTGPRPGPANLNILQLQSSGRGYGNAEFFGLGQHSLKQVQFYAGAVRVDIIDDTDDNPFSTPQTTGINTGEYARRDNQGLWNVFSNATVNLPEKLVFSANFNGHGMQAYNVTTGFDNNGDGDFNDRPQYAVPGTPLCFANPTASPCGYATPWGELVSSGGVGSLSRDKGVMPWAFYLDTNLQRTFNLTHNAKADHPQTLTANLRATNLLNHVNVTQVGGVLGSPTFGVPYAADNERRVEAGLRYSF